MIPIEFLTLFRIYQFFLYFSIFFLLIFMLNLLNNKIKKDFYSYELLFDFYLKLSVLKRFYLRIFYKFIYLSDLILYNGDKTFIKSLILVYNESKKKFQILAQYRPPNVVILLISFFLLIFV